MWKSKVSHPTDEEWNDDFDGANYFDILLEKYNTKTFGVLFIGSWLLTGLTQFRFKSAQIKARPLITNENAFGKWLSHEIGGIFVANSNSNVNIFPLNVWLFDVFVAIIIGGWRRAFWWENTRFFIALTPQKLHKITVLFIA